jgi:hypothetical protein
MFHVILHEAEFMREDMTMDLIGSGIWDVIFGALTSGIRFHVTLALSRTVARGMKI